MKNLFGINKDESKNVFNQFISRKISSDSEKSFEKLEEDRKNLKNKKIPPQWISVVSSLLMPLGLIFVVGIIFAKDGFINAIKTRGSIFYVGIVLFVVGLILYFFCRIKIKKSTTDEEVISFIEKQENFIKERFFELNIPDNAIEMDVIFSLVKLNKKGEEKIRQGAFIQHINQPLKIFVEKDNLCFGDSALVVSIPLNSLQSVEKINKRLPLPQWNKSEEFNSEKYKKYKMYTNQTGLIWTKSFYSIKMQIKNNDYYLLLPCYEIDVFISFVKDYGVALAISNDIDSK